MWSIFTGGIFDSFCGIAVLLFVWDFWLWVREFVGSTFFWLLFGICSGDGMKWLRELMKCIFSCLVNIFQGSAFFVHHIWCQTFFPGRYLPELAVVVVNILPGLYLPVGCFCPDAFWCQYFAWWIFTGMSMAQHLQVLVSTFCLVNIYLRRAVVIINILPGPYSPGGCFCSIVLVSTFFLANISQDVHACCCEHFARPIFTWESLV